MPSWQEASTMMGYTIPSRQEEAGNHRYSVGTDTPRFFATSLSRTPPAKSFLADSISAKLAITWKKNRPEAVLVSIMPPRPRRRINSLSQRRFSFNFCGTRQKPIDPMIDVTFLRHGLPFFISELGFTIIPRSRSPLAQAERSSTFTHPQ